MIKVSISEENSYLFTQEENHTKAKDTYTAQTYLLSLSQISPSSISALSPSLSTPQRDPSLTPPPRPVARAAQHPQHLSLPNSLNPRFPQPQQHPQLPLKNPASPLPHPLLPPLRHNLRLPSLLYIPSLCRACCTTPF